MRVSKKTMAKINNNNGRRSERGIALFIAIFTLLLVPAYGQQDLSPTWYDPAPSAVAHPAQAAAAVHSSQLPAAPHQNQQTAKALSPAPAATQLKNTKLDQSGRNAAHKSTAAPSGKSVSVALLESR